MGHMREDINQHVFKVADGQDIKLEDLWPSKEEVLSYVSRVDRTMFEQHYQNVFKAMKSGEEYHLNQVIHTAGARILHTFKSLRF